MKTMLVSILLLAACSSSSPVEPAAAPLPTERGDPSPPSWATPDLGWVGHPAYAKLFAASAETMPADLTHRHVVCRLVARKDGNPLEGALDLKMDWTIGGRVVQRLCNVDESPCTTGFPEGAVRVGEALKVQVADYDDPGNDDEVIGTYEGTVVAGQPFTLVRAELEIDCRAATPEVVREQLAPLLRQDLPKKVEVVERARGDARASELYAARNFLVRAAGIAGWDHPDVWVLTKRLAD